MVRGKNLRKIGNKSLVQNAAEFAENEPEIVRTIVSTDDYRIASEFGDQDTVNPFLRLPEGEMLRLRDNLFLHKRKVNHAGDDSRTVDTILDILSHEIMLGLNLVMLLQPTSPFRESGETQKVYNTLLRTNTETCVSAKLFDSPHPSKGFKLNEMGILESDKFPLLPVPRQLLEKMYVFDGAFYLTSIDTVKTRKSLLSPKTSIYVRSGLKTLNIDNEEDMKLAQLISLNPEIPR